MYHFLLTIHIIACLGMILFVLLQTGRGAGLSMFGGGGDSLINTPSGSSLMKKFTAGLAAPAAPAGGGGAGGPRRGSADGSSRAGQDVQAGRSDQEVAANPRTG